MARNGNGTFSLVAGNPVITGSVISSTWANNTLSDIATALTASVANDGQTPILADQDFGGFGINNLTTAPQFDNDQSAATTAFVQRALGNFRGVSAKSADFTIASTDVGTAYYVNSAIATVATLPAGAAMFSGGAFTITNINAGSCVLTPASGTIYSSRGSSATYTLYFGESATVVCDSINFFVIGGGVNAGYYTPTVSNVTNATAITAHKCLYSMAGKIVTVSGAISFTPTAAAITDLTISLPIPSNLATVYDLSGSGTATNALVFSQPVGFFASFSADRAECSYVANNAGSATTLSFTFQYEVI